MRTSLAQARIVAERAPLRIALCSGIAAALACVGSPPLAPPVRAEHAASLRAVANPDGQRLEVRFPCSELACAAWLYLPAGGQRPPVIVMAHGFGGTRDLFLPDYAERFARAGFAVFVFDYRSFGDSEGEPRQVVDIDQQLDDWRSALAHVRSRADVDAERLAIWGTSLSGGHVLGIAAEDMNVRAVIAQVPYVDGQAGESYSFGFRVRALWAIAHDQGRALLGRSPHYIAVIAPPGEFGAINTPDAHAAAQRLIPEALGWRNQVAARALLALGSYRPILRAREVEAPTLLLPARADALIPLVTVRALAGQMPRAEVVELEGGHFDSYGGPKLERAVAAQVEFLRRTLGPNKQGSAAEKESRGCSHARSAS